MKVIMIPGYNFTFYWDKPVGIEVKILILVTQGHEWGYMA